MQDVMRTGFESRKLLPKLVRGKRLEKLTRASLLVDRLGKSRLKRNVSLRENVRPRV